MTRKQKLFLNTIISLVYQIIAIVCGFILPKYFLTYYGSNVNGLVSSVSQFLGFISLAECGVGAVVQSSLYKPLAEKNEVEISKIIISAEVFFKKIARILFVYTGILMVFYPLITLNSFDYLYTFSLILIISISSFAQYYFGIAYRLLLNADQMAFIQLGLQAITLVLNTIFSVILMSNGVGIQFVKLNTSVLFLIQPLLLKLYVKKNYKLDKTIVLTEEPIKQKWNGLAQHIASVVLNNTDTVVLTLFSTLKNVSIYTVYSLVVSGVRQILMSLTTGMQSMLGNMYAKNESEKLNESFALIEWLLHTVAIFLFSCTGILIVPFVSVYTANITDANYLVPVFAVFLTASQAMYCLRLPYNIMVLAAGHYKETQSSAIIEACLNIVLSVTLVIKFGLVGVAVGTFLSMIYRTTYLAWYLSNNIIYRKFDNYIKHIVTDVLCVGLSILITLNLNLNPVNYYYWILDAIQVAILCLIITLIINFIFYKSYLLIFLKKFKN